MTNHPNRNRRFFLVDSYGRSYFEGRTFSRSAALEAARQIDESERPYGVFLAPEGDGDAEQIFDAAYPGPFIFIEREECRCTLSRPASRSC